MCDELSVVKFQVQCDCEKVNNEKDDKPVGVRGELWSFLRPNIIES